MRSWSRKVRCPSPDAAARLPERSHAMKNCIVLDDYQNAALGSARWDRIADRVAVSCVHGYLQSEEEVVARVGEGEIVVVMRERTRFPACLLDRLPRLRLIVTSGMRNAAID